MQPDLSKANDSISDNLNNTSIFPENFTIFWEKSKKKFETKEHIFCEKYICFNWEDSICISRIDQGQVDIWLDSWSPVVEQINVSVSWEENIC